jgi:bacteriorhodopsin
MFLPELYEVEKISERSLWDWILVAIVVLFLIAFTAMVLDIGRRRRSMDWPRKSISRRAHS